MRISKRPTSEYYNFNLEIGGLCIGVDCQLPDLGYLLYEHYYCFFSTKPAIFHLSVVPSITHPIGDLTYPDLTRLADCLSFHAGTCTGSIDTLTHRAELAVSQVRPFEDVDYFIRILIALLCFNAGGLLLHGAGIVWENDAHIFFGRSGSGKTTISHLAIDGLVLNDDLVVVLPVRNQWMVFATPFGSLGDRRSEQSGYPLFGLYRLVKDTHNYTKRLSPSRAVAELIGSVPILPSITKYQALALSRCDELSASIPVFYLHFRIDAPVRQIVNPKRG